MFSLGWLLLCVCFVLSKRIDSLSPQSKRQLNLWRQTLWFNVHFFIIQIYSYTKNTSQISYCSNQVQEYFPPYLLTQSNIPILSAYSWLLPRVSFKISLFESGWGSHLVFSTLFDLSLYEVKSGLLNNQAVLWKNYKNVIFHINPIQTGVKNIITTIF